MSISRSIFMDPDLVPSKKERLEKEAFVLFRDASHLNDAIHSLECMLFYTKEDKRKMILNLSILQLTKDRDETLEEAIKRYTESKKDEQQKQ